MLQKNTKEWISCRSQKWSQLCLFVEQKKNQKAGLIKDFSCTLLQMVFFSTLLTVHCNLGRFVKVFLQKFNLIFFQDKIYKTQFFLFLFPVSKTLIKFWNKILSLLNGIYSLRVIPCEWTNRWFMSLCRTWAR
jgi:hypothetical protein